MFVTTRPIVEIRIKTNQFEFSIPFYQLSIVNFEISPYRAANNTFNRVSLISSVNFQCNNSNFFISLKTQQEIS